MSLPHALLTALIERPASGLELAGRFDKSIGYFWSATHQQIYRELSKLESDGLIASEPEADARGRKRVYRALTKGRAELKRWIAQEDSPPVLRDSLLVRLRAEAAVGSGDLINAVRQRRAAHQEKLEKYQTIEERDFHGKRLDRPQALQHLILLAGVQHEQGWIDILTQALEILDEDAKATETFD